jgi:hypothetical protein
MEPPNTKQNKMFPLAHVTQQTEHCRQPLEKRLANDRSLRLMHGMTKRISATLVPGLPLHQRRPTQNRWTITD